MLTGNVVIYCFGLLWLHHCLRVSWATAFEYGLYPFVPADMVKLYLAALALPGAWKLVEPRCSALAASRAAAGRRTGR